jgi:hypothetical protein
MTITRKKHVRKDVNPSRKLRIAYTDEQKKALPMHARKYTQLKQHELRSWFTQEYRIQVSQGMISDWLSQKYVHLDEEVFRAQDLASFKQKSAHNHRIMMELSRYERQVRLRMALKRQKQSTLEVFWQMA